MNFVKTVLRQKQTEIANLKTLRDLQPSTRSFVDALRSQARTPALVAEIKPRSPSEGKLLDLSKLKEIIDDYNSHAQAISVLCDETTFGGGFDLLRKVRTMTDLPILAKEFILDVRQIQAARNAGADAVLLIAALLSRKQIQDLSTEAMQLGMAILFEVHEEKEIGSIPALPADSLVIGINNRNLRTLNIDLRTTERLAKKIRSKFPNHLLITESGVEREEDVRKLRGTVDGFLIGTGLLKMKSRDELLSSFSAIPKIKICGLTRAEDVDLCEKLGIEYVGFNFVPSSRRCISLVKAKKLMKRLKKAKAVGIFLSEQGDAIQATIDELGLELAQVYDYSRTLKNVQIIHAFRKIPSALPDDGFLLFDGPANGRFADHVKISTLPPGTAKRMFVAGGLSADSVRSVIEKLQPFAVDVASGVESAPGIKDPKKLEAFVDAVRSVSPAKKPSVGLFGQFGGMYVSELLVPALREVEAAFLEAKEDSGFQAELSDLLRNFAGRPTPITHAKHLSHELGCTVLLKREDLLHGGAHKTNNVLGQGLLAKRMGKKELIAETGAGQHGTAVAMVGALFGIPVKIFMGSKDISRQQPNVQRMKLFGAEVISVDAGSRSLKDAINEALRYYVAHNEKSYYVFGTVAGPHPFPTIVAEFQRVIGDEARKQCLEQFGKLPHTVMACVGGGSNAIGIFKAFLNDNVRLIGVEAAGKGLKTKEHGAALSKGRIGVLHGAKSYCLQDSNGQILEAHSISAGLDYPGVGPEHSFLKDSGRVHYRAATDREALDAFDHLSKKEGIIPALESAHAIAEARKMRGKLKKDNLLLINLSGRGDKDLDHVRSHSK